MISSYANVYCSEDVSKIKNFKAALKDNKRKWVCFHRNHISGVGYMTRKALISAGLWQDRPARELIFLKREDAEMLEREVEITKSNAYWNGVVAKFWTGVNPNSLLISLDEQTYNEYKRSIQRLRILRAQMNARCENPNAQDYRWYGAKGIKVCEEWREDSDKFVLWALKNGYRYNPELSKGEQLSIDRKDPSKDYCPENCRWIPHHVNCSRQRIDHKARSIAQTKVHERKRELGNMFKDAVMWNLQIDWRIVYKNHFNSNWESLKKFLYENGYNSVSVFRIHKKIEGRD